MQVNRIKHHSHRSCFARANHAVVNNQRPGVSAMRIPAVPKRSAASFENLKPACQILILHEDFPCYSFAVEICRSVMERFSSELDFDIKCWNFIELADPNCARHAAKTAGGADLVLVSMRDACPPLEFDRWLDFFFIARFKTGGMLALALNTSENAPSAVEKLELRLKQMAERLGMDFVSLASGKDPASLNLRPPVSILRASP